MNPETKMANINRHAKRLSERISYIKNDFLKSKQTLHGWVAEQKRLIDEESRQIGSDEEAIDVEYDEPGDGPVMCEKDETNFSMLMDAAERLLSDNSDGV